MMKGGLSSARPDVGALETKFRKHYLEAKYPLGVYEKKLDEWGKLRNALIGKQ